MSTETSQAVVFGQQKAVRELLDALREAAPKECDRWECWHERPVGPRLKVAEHRFAACFVNEAMRAAHRDATAVVRAYRVEESEPGREEGK